MAVEVASKELPVDASGAVSEGCSNSTGIGSSLASADGFLSFAGSGRDPLGDAFGACFVAPSDCLPRLFLKTCDCGFADAGVVFAMAW